jgi:glutamyl-tRNA synthetase
MTEITGPVRVRFAPSPTGFLHIGGVRTALFNWLFAQHYGGQFLLRLEDTDEKRFVPGSADDLMQSLRWVGLAWDEGPDVGGPHAPYIQSQRHEAGVYVPFVEQLLADGKAYMSFTTEGELAQMKAASEARGTKAFRFRGPERDWPLAKQQEHAAAGRKYSVRLKVPLEGTTSFSDLVRGGEAITISNAELYDIVLIKTTGMPVYHLAHLVDDHLMQITHVLRSDEWVPSTPYHLLLYSAFGWAPPAFAHLPPILRQDGRGKMSKRDQDGPANSFWERGYLPEAMLNYLALQGWSFDGLTEVMTREELIERFTLDRVQPSPARWNPEKLLDMNGIYIRRLSTTETARRIAPFLAQAGLTSDPPTDTELARIEQLTPLIHERLKTLGEAPELLDFFFQDVSYPDPALLVPKKMDAAGAIAALNAAAATLTPLEPWTPPQLEETLRGLAEELELKAGPLFGLLRVAVTGRTVAPPLFDTLHALGKARSLARIAAAGRALHSR